MIPFMFRVDDSPESKYVVKRTKCFDYISYKSEWMCDPALGDHCLVPDVDITEEQFEFDNEVDALKCMQRLWAEVVIPT